LGLEFFRTGLPLDDSRQQPPLMGGRRALFFGMILLGWIYLPVKRGTPSNIYFLLNLKLDSVY
jgi:hypothetical protein